MAPGAHRAYADRSGRLDVLPPAWRCLGRRSRVVGHGRLAGLASPGLRPVLGSVSGETGDAIQEAMESGQQVKAVNKATGNPATRYVHPTTGQSVGVDDVTGEVIHVGGPGFKYGPGSGDLP